MNLLQIQDALKNASDDQLMQLMQSPDSSAPSYLVLSEIRRRKDMRAQQPQEPQGTVADDLANTEQTYDRAGIRSLRTPGYEEEEKPSPDDMQGMREGGIVRMSGGGTPTRLEDFYTGRPLTEMSDEELHTLANSSPSQSRRLNLGALGIPQPSGLFQNQEQNDILAREARLLLARRMPSSPRLPEPEGMTGSTDQFYQQGDQQAAAAPPPVVPPPSGQNQPAPTSAPPPPPAATPGSATPPPPATTPTAPAAPAAAAGSSAGSAATGAGIRAVGSRVAGGEDGVLGSMRRLEAAFPNGLAGLRAELEKGRTNPEERKREATNLALVEAGLRMAASRNPSFLGSIGEGATPAVQSYSQQVNQIRQDERQDIRDRFSLEQANLQRMYALGQISAAEYRTRVAEAGANARLAASETAANERLRLSNERLTQQDRNTRLTAASASLRSNEEHKALGTQAAQLHMAVRNAREGSPERDRLESQFNQVQNRMRTIERDIYSGLGLEMQGNAGSSPGGSIVVRDGVQHYVRPGG